MYDITEPNCLQRVALAACLPVFSALQKPKHWRTSRQCHRAGTWLMTCLVLTVCAAAAPAGETDKPNLVWIWADNLAYGDLGVYGNREIKTPRIDSLATAGVRLTQYYIAHPVCSPSRAALLTGRQPFRVGIVDVLRPDGPTGLPAEEITLAEALKRQGYATIALGKWHLGDRREFLPLQHGFDRYFGLPYSMDMLPTVLYRDNEIVEALPGDKVQNVTERLTDEAIAFVTANRDRPFFMYFSHTIPHPPLNIPPKYRTPGRSIYADAIEYMDREVGRLLDVLDRLGLAERTLVVFTSDNGPMGKYGDTGGLRGRIRDSYEGGLRVPLVARLPGRIPPGKVVDTPAIAYDVFPTFVRLAGGELPTDRVYDGQDIWPVLSGKADRIERKGPLVWAYLDNVTAIRQGPWKLHVARRERPIEPPELYHLDRDPKEKTNLIARQPDVAKRLKGMVAEFEAEMPKVWSLHYPVRDPVKAKGGLRRK